MVVLSPNEASQHLTITNDAFLSFRALAESLTYAERNELKLALSLKAAALFENCYELPTDVEKRQTVHECLTYLRALQPYYHQVPDYGVAFIGWPNFMTKALLAQLQTEAVDLRPEANDNNYQFITQEGPIAQKLAESGKVQDFVRRYVLGNFKSSHIQSYLYYDHHGQKNEPHVDNEYTALTCMISLKHTYLDEAKASATVFYDANKGRKACRLIPGEAVIFYGASTLHGRLTVQPEEEVHLLQISFVHEDFMST